MTSNKLFWLLVCIFPYILFVSPEGVCSPKIPFEKEMVDIINQTYNDFRRCLSIQTRQILMRVEWLSVACLNDQSKIWDLGSEGVAPFSPVQVASRAEVLIQTEWENATPKGFPKRANRVMRIIPIEQRVSPSEKEFFFNFHIRYAISKCEENFVILWTIWVWRTATGVCPDPKGSFRYEFEETAWMGCLVQTLPVRNLAERFVGLDSLIRKFLADWSVTGTSE